MQYHDYYKTLGVKKSATASQIQKAYRRLARKYHPDINREPDAENRFKEIGEAYEVLGEEEKRKRFDQYGSAWKKVQTTGAPPPEWQSFRFDLGGSEGGAFDPGASGFSSFFEMLFGDQLGGFKAGGSRWRSSPPGNRPPTVGQDRESRLVVGLEELARGGPKKIELVDPLTGERKSLVVTLPKGVLPGQKIRLSGQGDPGRGGRAGDLYLKLQAREHPTFRLKDRDLYMELLITPWEAALGTSAWVPTLEEPVEIRLPAGSSSGRNIRLRGRGMPNPKGNSGDLYVELKIVIPDRLTEEEKELFERLRESSDFSPRPEPSVATP